MKLKEFEACTLLQCPALRFPRSLLISSLHELPKSLPWPRIVVKAQTLQKKRGRHGMIRLCSSHTELQQTLIDFFNVQNPEPVKEILLQEYIEHTQEYYLSFAFDTAQRAPVMIFSTRGGIDIEEMQQQHPEAVAVEAINALIGLSETAILDFLKKAGIPSPSPALVRAILAAYHCFEANDARLLEINPLVESAGSITALDANIDLDDAALSRHSFSFPERTGTRAATEREKAAREIDKEDYRGTAGKTYLDLDGDIAILASGGGASLVALDALLSYGGKPANYTEYSGNPPREKVEQLARIALSKPGLHGCWVVGGTANFTDIYETLSGFFQGLLALSPKPDFPIVVRRAGPRDKEAFEMLKQCAVHHGFNIHLYDEKTPITETAKIITELAAQHAGEKEKNNGNTH